MKIVQVKDKDTELKGSQGIREGGRICSGVPEPAYTSSLERNSIVKHRLYCGLNYINLQCKLLY